MTILDLKQPLADAEAHVAYGEAAVVRQRDAIIKLQRESRDTEPAQKFLTDLEQTLALYVADRDRLRRQVARVSH